MHRSVLTSLPISKILAEHQLRFNQKGRAFTRPFLCQQLALLCSHIPARQLTLRPDFSQRIEQFVDVGIAVHR